MSKNLEDSDSDEEESKPPIKIDTKPLSEKLSESFNSFIQTMTGSKKEDNKKKKEFKKIKVMNPMREVKVMKELK